MLWAEIVQNERAKSKRPNGVKKEKADFKAQINWPSSWWWLDFRRHSHLFWLMIIVLFKKARYTFARNTLSR